MYVIVLARSIDKFVQPDQPSIDDRSTGGRGETHFPYNVTWIVEHWPNKDIRTAVICTLCPTELCGVGISLFSRTILLKNTLSSPTLRKYLGFWFRHERANLFGRCQSWTHKENLQDTLQHFEQFKGSFLLFYCQEWSLVQAVSFAVYKVRPICRVSDSGIGCCNWAITSGPGIRICARWTNRAISAFDLPHIFSAVHHIANNNVYNPVVLTVHSLTSCNS